MTESASDSHADQPAEQFDSPDSQAGAEATDADQLGLDEDYGGDEPLDYPPTRAAERTAEEADDRYQDSVADRSDRELPDPLVEQLDHPERRPVHADDPRSLGALRSTTDVLDDDEATLIGFSVPPLGDESAEELALHLDPER